MRKIRVALCSGGRESTAMVDECERRFGKDFFDIKIFADTGDDPQGRATIDYLNNYHDWGCWVVQSKHGNIIEYYENADAPDREDSALDGHAMPHQSKKDCSQKFKIAPVRAFCRFVFGKAAKFIMYYGFTFSKKDTKRKFRLLDKKYKVSYISLRFPLIDIFKFDRQHCTDICKKLLGFVPEPSLCDMCFERTIPQWREFGRKHKEKLLKLIKFEESSHLFKVFGTGLNVGYPLRRICHIAKDGQSSLADYDEEIENTIKQHQSIEDISPSCSCMNDNQIGMPTEFDNDGFKVLHVGVIKNVKPVEIITA